jgi:hypothetical protein
VPIPPAYEAMLNMSLSKWRADFDRVCQGYSEGYSNFTTEDVEQLTGHRATSYKEFATDFERVFRGA